MSGASFNPYGQPPIQPPFPHPYPPMAPPPPPGGRRGTPAWVWVVVILGSLVILSCAGVLGLVGYVGAKGPGTKVLTSNEIPKRFVDTARELNLLDSGESIRFFYSDAMVDIRNGMYLVTDRKVAIYIADSVTPRKVVLFNEIIDAELASSESWLSDGSITLHLKDGTVVVFPVSSEDGRDKLVYEAIEASIGAEDDEDSPPVEIQSAPTTALDR